MGRTVVGILGTIIVAVYAIGSGHVTTAGQRSFPLTINNFTAGIEPVTCGLGNR
jgi:hypothetical protein